MGPGGAQAKFPTTEWYLLRVGKISQSGRARLSDLELAARFKFWKWRCERDARLQLSLPRQALRAWARLEVPSNTVHSALGTPRSCGPLPRVAPSTSWQARGRA